MKILNDLIVDKNVNTVDVEINKNNIATNTGNISANATNIALKANSSELPTGNVDSSDLGKLTNISFNTVSNEITFSFEGGDIFMEAPVTQV